MRSLSSLIQEERAKRGMTIAQLAEEVGYDRAHFGLLEKGRRHFNDEAAVRLALVLGMDPTEALLAGVRERLPEELRQYMPSTPPTGDPRANFVASRLFQAQHFDFEVKRLRMEVSSDWEGNLSIVRTLEECRPNAALRPVSEIRFRERVLGAEDNPDVHLPRFELLRAPAKLNHEVTSKRVGSWLHHRIFFPNGWRRKTQQKDDAFSFRFQTLHSGGLTLEATQFQKQAEAEGLPEIHKGSLNVYVRHFINRLEVKLTFPRGYHPELWQSWVRWGRDSSESASHNLGGQVCRSLVFRPNKNQAKLIVDEPLAGYSYSILWTPLDHQRYLEAHHGDVNA